MGGAAVAQDFPQAKPFSATAVSQNDVGRIPGDQVIDQSDEDQTQ
jgi:hypothetical protein